MAGDASEPLLQNGPTEAEVPEDLERGLSAAPGHDFRHLIDAQPEAVIRQVPPKHVQSARMHFEFREYSAL